MVAKAIQSLIVSGLVAGMALCSPVHGGVLQDEAPPGQAMEFIESELPELHAELEVILGEMPEMVKAVNETVADIHEAYLRFSEMSPELAHIFLTIKKREFQNQIMAEKIQALTDPEKRSAEFRRLVDHMNVTFDLHLRLVKGEVAWLEQEIEGLKELVASEQSNKKRFVQEDLVSLLLNNDPLLRISIRGLGEKQTKDQQAELRKLIEKVAPTKAAAE